MSEYRPTGFQIMPPVVKNLLIINGILFLGTEILKQSIELDLMQYLALHFFTAESFMPHQFVTHIFMHGGFFHILFNMLSLWMFGAMLENLWGSRKFLIFYMICGIGASLTHQAYTGYKLMPAFRFEETQNTLDFREMVDRNEGLLELAAKRPEYAEYSPTVLRELADEADKKPKDTYLPDVLKARAAMIKSSVENIPTVGASGAIYGLLMAFGMIFPNMLIHFMFFIPMRAKHFVILMIAIGVFYGVADLPGDQVAHFAHLGGMAFGFLMIKLWSRKRTGNF